MNTTYTTTTSRGFTPRKEFAHGSESKGEGPAILPSHPRKWKGR